MTMMQTEKSEMVGGLTAGLGETHLEVVIAERGGEQVISLQLSTWSEALGWQVQKTIPFAADKLGQLQRLLSQARSRIEDQQATVGAPAVIIPLAARGAAAPPSSAAQPMHQVEAAPRSAAS